METLLCRRFDLARASGATLDGLDPVVRHHLEACGYCQEAMRLDQAVHTALNAGRAAVALPVAARRRIEALVSVKSREDRPAVRLPVLGAAGGAVALAIVLTAFLRPWSADSATPAGDPPPVIVAGEPLTGLGELVARHHGIHERRSILTPGAVLLEEKLPPSLAGRIASEPGTFRAAAYDGKPSTAEGPDATLFVLDAGRVVLDPVIRDVLAEHGTLTLPHGADRVTLASRGGRVFVVVTAAGDPAAPPPL